MLKISTKGQGPVGARTTSLDGDATDIVVYKFLGLETHMSSALTRIIYKFKFTHHKEKLFVTQAEEELHCFYEQCMGVTRYLSCPPRHPR